MSFSRVFFALWSLLFLLFAYWQWNDPDPEIWLSIYGFAAVMCALAAFRRFDLPVLFASGLAALIGGLYLFPPSVTDWISQESQQADLSMKTHQMELARESFGLLIVAAILGFAAYRGWVQKRVNAR